LSAVSIGETEEAAERPEASEVKQPAVSTGIGCCLYETLSGDFHHFLSGKSFLWMAENR
jgi:hypothetical protein